MLSERLMVERRWAMEMVVLLPFRRAVKAALTRVSDSASRADVAGIRLVVLSLRWRRGQRKGGRGGQGLTFVQDQDVRVLDQCSRNSYPLLLTTR